jgi:hypothetical protein
MSPVRAIGKRGYGPVGGPADTIKAAQDLITRCGQWPYPWSYPPPGSMPMGMRGTIGLPAQGVQTQVCSFNVPVGKLGYLDSLMLQIQDTNYVEGMGYAIWAVVVNQPAAAAFAIGRPAVGYGLVTTQFGSIAHGAAKLPFGVLLGSNDTLYIHITIPAAPAGGGGNPLGVGFPSSTTCWGLGWIWPADKAQVGM